MVYDVHAHPFFIREACKNDEEIAQRRHEFGLYKVAIQDIELFKKQIKAAEIDKVFLLPLDMQTITGATAMTNDRVAEVVGLEPDIFIGFASVDPHLPNAAEKLEQDIRQYKLKGIKLNPTSQNFKPNDKGLMYGIYQKAQELNVPIMFHSGMTWEPWGLTANSHPLLLEEVAQDFPRLRIALAHFSWPWVAEACIMAVKYENVFVDTALLYFDSPLEFFKHVFNGQISHTWIERSIPSKILFGSNYPRIEQKRMRTALESIGLSKPILNKIYHENPVRFLG
jgi:predicted TIM-barrel fold metal-dependent hydrolase